MQASNDYAVKIAGLGAFSRLVRQFSDTGLNALIAAGREGRLRRGVWNASSGGLRLGCPLSCADGVAGFSRASRFWLLAPERNTFVLAWDAGQITSADVLAMATIEIERRAARRDRVAEAVAALRGAIAALTIRRPALAKA